MTFRELIRDPFLQTPRMEVYAADFQSYVKEQLNEFYKMVLKLEDEDLNISGVSYHATFVKRMAEIMVKGINECIEMYLEGKINEAYAALDRTLKHETKDFYAIISQFKIDKQTDFYRIREQKENVALTPAELFHIPFELRGCVQNQRFSINGFPSLYLSSNLYTCWEELQQPGLNNFQAIRFRNIVELNVLDLSPPLIERRLSRSNYRFLLIWPVIFACSVRVKNKKDVFKPEYIIPQLLLQWVRQNDDIDCIRYFSTNIDQHNTLSTGDFSNYVFPVKNSAKKGYCEDLKSYFRHTEPISWQTFQMATGGQEFTYTEKDFEKINARIPHLEIIKGRSYPYSYSILGKLEYYLDKMKTKAIDF